MFLFLSNLVWPDDDQNDHLEGKNLTHSRVVNSCDMSFKSKNCFSFRLFFAVQKWHEYEDLICLLKFLQPTLLLVLQYLVLMLVRYYTAVIVVIIEGVVIMVWQHLHYILTRLIVVLRCKCTHSNCLWCMLYDNNSRNVAK